jgi:hypothetical protein
MLGLGQRSLVAGIAILSLVVVAPASAFSLAAEWTFDEGAGQVAHDRAGAGLDGRLGVASGPDGADPAWLPGLAGAALRFDGGDAVVVPDSPRLEPATLSIEVWIRRQGTPGRYAYVVSKGSAGCNFSS